MKILILGPTGKTGQEIVKQALDRGYAVTALARDPSKLNVQHTLFSALKGDVLDKEILSNAIEGKDAVISALGVGKSLKSGDLIYNATNLIIPVMKEKKVTRLIFLSAFGVGDTYQQANWLQKLAFSIPLKNMYADKAKGDVLIKNSDLNWTLVYPALLTDKPFTGNYKVGEIMIMKGFPKVSRADVAHFIIQQIADDMYVRKSPIIAG